MRGMLALFAALLVAGPGVVASLMTEPLPQPHHWPTYQAPVSPQPVGREVLISEGTPPVAQFGLLPQSAAKPVVKAAPVQRYMVRRSCGPGGCR